MLTSGLAGAVADWDAVTRLLAPAVRVLRFDRPGIGASTLSPSAVLVGHSLAGLHVEAYTRLRPARVRGAVLVDPSLAPPGIGRRSTSAQ